MQVVLKSNVQTKNFENKKKIVVLSDTHIPVNASKIPEQILDEFKDANLIVNSGDFHTIEVVQELENYGNFVAVHGNMDSDDIVKKLPEKVIININNGDKKFKIGLTHGYGAPEGIEERVSSMFNEKLDCIIFGHSHKPFNNKIGDTLFFNPGSVTDNRFSNVNTFGILRIDNEINGEIIDIK